jgi:Protein of unknown function (DUF2452)
MPDHPVIFAKKPNPQGKGLVPLLRDWRTVQPSVSGAKSPADFLRDYCLSSLVLSAHFRFKPVVGKPYFLYASEQDWSLSLIAPQEWGQRKVGDFVATCRLRPDITWEMDTSELDEHSPALATAQIFICGFVDAFAKQDCISAYLPFYCASLPYYQRLLGTALSSSLQRSLPYTGDKVQDLLTTLPTPLLATSARTPVLLRVGLDQ